MSTTPVSLTLRPPALTQERFEMHRARLWCPLQVIKKIRRLPAVNQLARLDGFKQNPRGEQSQQQISAVAR